MNYAVPVLKYLSSIQWSLFFLPIFDLLKAASWPLVALMLGVLYRSDIKDLLSRTESVGKDQIKFSPRNQDKAKSGAILDDKIENSGKDGLPETTPSVFALEERLMEQLPTLDPENKTRIIIRDLAVARLIAAFEMTYRVIFGSQIRFLRSISDRRSVNLNEVQSYFEGVRLNNFEAYSEGYEGWLRFIVNSNLVTILNGNVEITQYGLDFLNYLKKWDISENKPL